MVIYFCMLYLMFLIYIPIALNSKKNEEKFMIKKKAYKIFFTLLAFAILIGCNNPEENTMSDQTNIIFLHHSTGKRIWRGDVSKIANAIGFSGDVSKWFDDYNKNKNKNYVISETNFPKESPYGWRNYPYDYYNIWVKNAGDKPFKDEPTLEILTSKYDVIIFKHCFPVSNIKPNTESADINSEEKTLDNYKLQYNALKEKMLQFPDTKFIIWTPTAQVEKKTNIDEAKRANEFSEWVKTEWDVKGDNIFLWDFRALQVEGGLYFKDEYADSPTDSHPNKEFSHQIAPFFCNRVVNVIEDRGDSSDLTGK